MSEFPDPPYFHVRDLARRWEEEETIIDRFIFTKQLRSVPELAAKHGCHELRYFVSQSAIQARLPNPVEVQKINEFTPRDGVLWVRSDEYYDGRFYPEDAEEEAIDRKQNELFGAHRLLAHVVLLADVLAFEKKHGIKTKTPPVRGIEMLNTPDHPAYAPELAAAVEVWLRVYGDMKTADDLKKLKDRGKEVRKQKYAEALKSCGIPGLEGEGVLSRLLTVCNPQATKQKGVNLPD